MFRSLRLSFVCCPASDLRNYVRYVQILLPPHRKSVSESKNMMSYFASEVVRYGIYITKQDRFKISSRSKNMMSDFAPEAANSPNVAPNPKVVQNGV